MARRRRLLPDLDRSGGFVGMAALACVLFVYLASVEFLRWYAVLALVVVWLVLLAVGARWFTPAPRRVLLLPVAGLLVWAGVVWLAAR
ncbi:hypothetical protein GCM10011519_00250 [Marmoricola endophyticus]|uniref:Uncharacterized protein n=1 Tax=Marmoricola endophyticus TaxID=2040280 RepID=A0A917B937_9ACTN|nr:hypothetical protein [Marmoricola endophyticus]GGF30760.1 hypothetical protein GCM10011519_00250 [Marmoricola endophyticus]